MLNVVAFYDRVMLSFVAVYDRVLRERRVHGRHRRQRNMLLQVRDQ